MGGFLNKVASLTPAARQIICDKATEYPHSGKYNLVVAQGSYLCRRCGLALFRADNQFSSGCGWPSFDAALSNAVKQQTDQDGLREEILCSRCDAHLGHVFIGEYLTEKNCRYCVNAASLDFVADNQVIDTEEAILAGGCFWGVDYYLHQLVGVIKVEVGYSGGVVAEPSYQQICQGDTGHYEVIRVIFDKAKTNYAKVLKRFFEIHDPTQRNGQGPDLGFQYQSAVFYYNSDQQQQAELMLQVLRKKGYDVATRLLAAQPFWPAEEYHQNYYRNQNAVPYCHKPVLRFADQ